MTNVLAPPRNATRLQLRRYHRACLVHTAGEATIHPWCATTQIYLDPWSPINDLDDPPTPGVGAEVLASGARIPRSLRRLYLRQNAENPRPAEAERGIA
jgi:hypothetical protein